MLDDPDDMIRNYGRPLLLLKTKLRDILSKIKTVKYPYDMRPINGPPFTCLDFHDKWPNISCQLTDEEEKKAKTLNIASETARKYYKHITDKDGVGNIYLS